MLVSLALCARQDLRVAACEILQGVGDGAAVQVLVAATINFGVCLFEQHNPGLMRLGTMGVHRPAIWRARNAVVDGDQLPLPMLEEAESVYALLAVFGGSE